jgi:uncharacterized protein YbjT (DUF2867 family)
VTPPQRAPSALLVGATGVVGREILRRLLVEGVHRPVSVIARRPLPPEVVGGDAGQLVVRVADFEQLYVHAEWTRADHVFCALGTTIRQAGSQQRFRRVDFDYPLTIARLAAERGASHFLLVSALGADARSRVFYSRVKGELEDAVSALPYRSVTIVRPSLLMGERTERRLGEEIGKRLAFLAPRRYKPVSGEQVADALVRAAIADRPGRRIIESRELH